MNVLYLVGGLIFLIAGAEALVRGASRLALALGISPLVIGLTVVSYGTSAPEAAVGVLSALSGQVDLAVGNVVGSNIFNVLLILGLAALVTPLVVAQQLIRLDVPLMIAVSLLVLIFGLDGRISGREGLVLGVGILAYTLFLAWQSRRESRLVQIEYEREYGVDPPRGAADWAGHLGLVVVGLVGLVVGARWLVTGASAIAAGLGVSSFVIGLTVVAGGTSLPEVATSVIASLRGQRDIAVGNVVGSNLFNLLGVLGLTALVAPQGLPVSEAALRFDLPVMVGVAIACLPVFFTGHLISRWEGGLFLAYYVLYLLFTILAAGQSALLPPLQAAMLWFVLPLTGLTLAVGVLRALRARSAAHSR